MENNRIAELLRQILDAVANAGGVSEWGDITGTLSNQTDLQDVLDLKEDLANKATNFSTLDDDLYPTTNATNVQIGVKISDRVDTQTATSYGSWGGTFERPYQFGDSDNPITLSAKTLVTTNAKVGTTVTIYADAGTPENLTGITLRGIGDGYFVVGAVNIVQLTYRSSTQVEIIISQENLYPYRSPSPYRLIDSCLNTTPVVGISAFASGDASSAIGQISGRPCARQLSTGTGATNVAAVRISTSTFRLGTNAMYISTFLESDTLSTGSQRYAWKWAFDTSSSSIYSGSSYVGTDLAGFYYRDDLNSGKIIAASRNNNGTVTATDTLVTFTAGTWYMLAISVNNDATEIRYTIYTSASANASLVKVYDEIRTTPLPRTSVNVAMGVSLEKSVGTTASVLNVYGSTYQFY